MVWAYNYREDNLVHYGILGMKPGQRRFQRKDGSLTSPEKNRYKYTSMSTKRYSRKDAKNREKAAEHRRYAEDYNPKNYIGKSKYTDKQRARDQKKMDRELAKAKKQSYADQRSTGEALVKTILSTSITMNGRSYKDYMQNQASGMSKGKAMVSAVLLGDLGAMYMKHRYITQDERNK